MEIKKRNTTTNKKKNWNKSKNKEKKILQPKKYKMKIKIITGIYLFHVGCFFVCSIYRSLHFSRSLCMASINIQHKYIDTLNKASECIL